MAEISSNVRAEMARAGVTQVQLGAHLGMAQSAISKRLKGDTPWRVDELQRVAAYLDIPLSTLLPEREPAAS
jgi:transcriptional regulator with XRE-family HTH domain